MVLIWIGLLILSFYALARLVDVFFVETLEIISKRLKLSSDIAGATFMAVGSSAPELFVSILALFRVGEQQAMGAGTIVGSAIFNILVIVGASALVRRATLTWQPVIRDLLFYVLCIVVLLLTFIDGQITLWDSLIYLGLYGVYLMSFGVWKRVFPYADSGAIEDEMIAMEEAEQARIRAEGWSLGTVVDKSLSFLFFDLSKRPSMLFVNFGVSIVLLSGISHLMVESAVEVAHFFNLPEVIIALTILAAGTSVPDLMSSINVARRGKGDMAISNAVGSNIFDIAIGLGVPWFLVNVFSGESVPVVTENLESSIVLLLATVVALLFLLVARKWAIGRYAGMLLIGAYIWYILSSLHWVSWHVCIPPLGNVCVGM